MTASLVSPSELVDPALHATGDPHGVWRWMRRHSPVHRHEAGDHPSFWSLTRYDDIRAAYRDPARFSSAGGVLLRPSRHGVDPGGGMTLALTDPPRHRGLRGVVADWFNARSVRDLEGSMRTMVRRLVADVVERGGCEFVHDVAGRLSIAVISGLIGVPEQDHEQVYRWTNEAFAAHVSLAAHQELMRYLIDLMYERMAEPADDLLSALVGGTVAGELLTEEEVLLNCENLIGATENGRLAIAGGARVFAEQPEQWRRLRADRSLLPSAVEEILRWTSSATHSMRTLTEPVEIRGQRMAAGDRVVLWVPSANRDEDVFDDPYRFDIGRTPNRHLALGGGEHFCLGAVLARTQMRLLFDELLDAVAVMAPDGSATNVHSNAVGGPQTLPLWLGR